MQKYGTEHPPEFDLSKRRVPVFLVGGFQDSLCPVEDLRVLRDALGSEPLVRYDEYDIGHVGTMFDREMPHLPDIISMVLEYSTK